MEYPLTGQSLLCRIGNKCLNPCSNGIPSDSWICACYRWQYRLNPCSNGIPSDNIGGEIRKGIVFV